MKKIISILSLCAVVLLSACGDNSQNLCPTERLLFGQKEDKICQDYMYKLTADFGVTSTDFKFVSGLTTTRDGCNLAVYAAEYDFSFYGDQTHRMESMKIVCIYNPKTKEVGRLEYNTFIDTVNNYELGAVNETLIKYLKEKK